jgi:hypothetical protein
MGREGRVGRAEPGWIRAACLASVMVLFLAGSPTVAAQSVLDRRAGLSVRSAPLIDALRQLQRSANVSLAYSPDLLPPGRIVSCVCEDLTVRQALERLLRGTDLTALASGTQVRLVPDRNRREREGGTLMGRVLDEEGRPVVNAMVQVSGGPGALSDDQGRFVVRGVAPGIHDLTGTSIGWRAASEETVTIVAADTTLVTLRMVRAPVPLPEVLVAPGTFGVLEDVSPGVVRSLTREEIQTLPQLGEDIFRAVQRLPGVASDDISTRLVVRGGPDRELMVLLDGLELYEPYHLKDWDGVLGIVDLNALGGVELIAGGFGADRGDRLSGVFDMTSRTSTGEARTTVGLSISNVTAMSRGGFAGDRGAWLLSGRRGFVDLVMDLVGESDRLSPRYYDVFGKLQYQVSTDHVVSAHVLRAGDAFVLADAPFQGADTLDFVSGWTSSYGWVTWDATPGSMLRARSMAWVGRLSRERTGFLVDLNEAPLRSSVDDDRAFGFGGLRHDLSVELGAGALLRVGAEVKRMRADFAYADQTWTPFVTSENTRGVWVDSTSVDVERSGYEASGYLAFRARPEERLTAEVGLRYDRMSHTREQDVSPRVLAALEVSPTTTARGSWGVYRQSQGVHELEVGDGQTAYHPAERGEQVALGLERRLGRGLDLRVEAYQRMVADRNPVYVNAEEELEVFPEAAGDRRRIDPGRGRARGIEVVLERRTGGPWTWTASYVLAVAEEELEGGWVPTRFDQRHSVGFFASYRPDRRWNVSLGWRYHTGWPATSWTYSVETLGDGWNHWTREYGPFRGARLPSYHRLDLRVSRSFDVQGNELHAFLDLFNVYDRLNLGSFAYDGTYENGVLSVTRVPGRELLPFLPTFGVRYEF